MMGVFIKGMEMPQKCGQCKLYHAEYPMYCLAVEGYRTVGAPYGMPRPDWCPLVEVKEPHGRLIDADAFKENHNMKNDCVKCEKELQGSSRACEYDRIYSKMDFCGWLDDADTVIETERSET